MANVLKSLYRLFKLQTKKRETTTIPFMHKQYVKNNNLNSVLLVSFIPCFSLFFSLLLLFCFCLFVRACVCVSVWFISWFDSSWRWQACLNVMWKFNISFFSRIVVLHVKEKEQINTIKITFCTHNIHFYKLSVGRLKTKKKHNEHGWETKRIIEKSHKHKSAHAPYMCALAWNWIKNEKEEEERNKSKNFCTASKMYKRMGQNL